MIDFRPVLHIVGLVLSLLAGLMVLPAALDAILGDDEWQVFLASAGFTLFVGLSLVLGTQSKTRRLKLNVRQAYLTIALGWLAPCLFAALPLAFGGAHLPIIDAIFEATSGITTTASTVIVGLDRLPAGTLLWRGLLQWSGGLAIIIMGVAVLPMLNIGGMQMFRIEILSQADRATSRAARMGATMIMVYAGLTVALALGLWAAGMGRFHALVHALGIISTGGFGTFDTSLAHFDRARIDLIAMIGMVLGGMPFLLFFQTAQGNWRRALKDQQLHWYLGLMALGGVAVTLWLMNSRSFELWTAIRHGFFTVVSVMTGTGLTTIDYSDWTGLPVAVLFFLTFVGGCAGSTAAGMKVFRFQLLFANALVQARHLLRPHAVQVPSFNKKPISEELLEAVMGFLFVYVLAFAVLAMLLSFMGLDFITAISGSASALANLGPGLGDTIGPGGTYATLPDAAKVLLAGGMLFGRLEMFTILVLFVPSFWEQ